QMQTEREQVAQHDLKTKLGMVSAGRVLDGWIVDIDGKVDAAATVGRDAGGVEAGARLEAVRERFGCGQRVSGGAEFLIVAHVGAEGIDRFAQDRQFRFWNRNRVEEEQSQNVGLDALQ